MSMAIHEVMALMYKDISVQVLTLHKEIITLLMGTRILIQGGLEPKNAVYTILVTDLVIAI